MYKIIQFMWKQNPDTNKWTTQTEILNKSIYNNIRQDLEDLRFYSRCLEGTTYVRTDNVDDIYGKLRYLDYNSWSFDTTELPDSGNLIDDKLKCYDDLDSSDGLSTFSQIWNDYNTEMGFSVKNLFTPDRVINQDFKNYNTVDLCTTTEIPFINDAKPGLKIDNVRVLVGHIILIKDQITYVTLDNIVNPNTYFTGNYYVQNVNATTTDYYYYNEVNGIYTYSDTFYLVKTDDLLTYNDSINYAVSVKLGIINTGKQFNLSRLQNGFYPTTFDNLPIEFTEKHNWVVRNNVEYQNILDIDYNDSLIQPYQLINGTIINDRYIFVGDFGSILVKQGTYIVPIYNEVKKDLLSISSVDKYYYTVGENGTILRINKISMEIKVLSIENEFSNFNHIVFFNNNLGFIVGDNNSIYYTINSGDTWLKLTFDDLDNIDFNKLVFINSNTLYIVGDNGSFVKVCKINDIWVHVKIEIDKYVDKFDTYPILSNLNDVIYIKTDTWNIDNTSSSISTNKEFLLIVSSNSDVIVYDLNNFTNDTLYNNSKFIFLNSIDDINMNISAVDYSDGKILYVSDTYNTSDINSFMFIPDNSNIVNGEISLIFNNKYNNININNADVILIGNDITIDKYIVTDQNTLISLVDSTYLNSIKSKMVFLDYDTGAKLNFFDEDSEYKLPLDLHIDYNINDIDKNVNLTSITGENSWLDYDKDITKQFQYPSNLNLSNGDMDESNIVRYNSEFRYGLSSSISFTSGTSSITTDTTLVDELLNFNEPSDTSYTFYIDMASGELIINSNLIKCIPGDLIDITSDIIDGILMVNKVEIISDNTYIYIHSLFDNNMMNTLSSTSTNIIIRNLNVYGSDSEFIDRFNTHYIGNAYNVGNDMVINALFNEKTAYYNLQLNIYSTDTLYNKEMLYNDKFLKFGYTAQYNLLDYLSNIDSVFTYDKEFLSMPIYKDLVASNESVLAFDNKLSFNSALEFEYNTLYLNTFIDILVDNELTEQVLIINKYFDDESGRFIIELNDEINVDTSTALITITSRRKLGQISRDLNELNNIQRNNHVSSVGTFSNYKNSVISKFNTDSYARVFLADGDIKSKVSAILYTDYTYEYAMNMLRFYEESNISISNITSINTPGGVKCIMLCDEPHNLKKGDVIFLNTTGAQYNGLATILSADSTNDAIIDVQYNGTDGGSGKFSYIEYDQALKYLPIDLIDVGTDDKSKISIMIPPDNININSNSTVSLVDLDYTKYRFNLVDGLYLSKVSEKYPWILEAEMQNAVIGEDENGVIWYSGIWECGRWFSGTWYSGTWLNGEWYDGTIYSYEVSNNSISANVNFNVSDPKYTKWYGGNFRDGTWENGTWYNGRHLDGTWSNGTWYDGTWYDGTWLIGSFHGGVWVSGEWYDGIMDASYADTTWLDGTWYGGDFRNGIWYNGKFSEKNNKSRFGTLPNNTRKAIFEGGKWYGGEFHSIINVDTLGNTLPSINNKYSHFKTGVWYGGEFFGGTIHSASYNNGTINTCLLTDINIIGVRKLQNSTIFKLMGVYRFNPLDNFYINGDIDTSSSFYALGSNNEPVEYVIKKVTYEYDLYNNEINTFVEVINVIDPSIPDVTNDTIINNKSVSKLYRSDWKNGIFMNGMLYNSTFINGLVVNGTLFEVEWL